MVLRNIPPALHPAEEAASVKIMWSSTEAKVFVFLSLTVTQSENEGGKFSPTLAPLLSRQQDITTTLTLNTAFL